jgi:hypothetical protein
VLDQLAQALVLERDELLARPPVAGEECLEVCGSARLDWCHYGHRGPLGQ